MARIHSRWLVLSEVDVEDGESARDRFVLLLFELSQRAALSSRTRTLAIRPIARMVDDASDMPGLEVEL
jgi:hypothetical protein